MSFVGASALASARSALGFREWALRVLRGRASAPGQRGDAALAGWRLFLGVERCALPLTRALGGPITTRSDP